jgi:acid stress-induced BolA-like protein IbaG/YrbA
VYSCLRHTEIWLEITQLDILKRYNSRHLSIAILEPVMLTPEEVKAMIASLLSCEYLEVEGDGHHFFAQIVSTAFTGKSRLARHRMIKDGLAQQIASNELHALSITTAATPAEWAAKQH